MKMKGSESCGARVSSIKNRTEIKLDSGIEAK
jgi:hypothetical protein